MLGTAAAIRGVGMFANGFATATWNGNVDQNRYSKTSYEYLSSIHLYGSSNPMVTRVSTV